MRASNVCVLCALLALTACGAESDAGGDNAVMMDAEEVSAAPVAPADAKECDQAKEAAVAARAKYDRDYESRNPGAESKSLSADELTSCRLTEKGAFLGKWGGQRWRYVPKLGSKYATDPKQVWVGQDEGLDDLSWFSEWRADGASVKKSEELNSQLKAARKIYG